VLLIVSGFGDGGYDPFLVFFVEDGVEVDGAGSSDGGEEVGGVF
jgi:hypothetical protein